VIVRRARAELKDPLERLLLPAALVASVVIGRFLARGGALPVVAALGLAAAIVIAYRPRIGLYACYPLLLLVPYDSLRLDFPIFHSPLQIVAMLTLGIAVVRALLNRGPLPRSRVFPAIGICILVLAVYAMAGHGPAAGERLQRFLQDLWPLVLIPLLVRSPRQARNVLLALCGSMLGLTLLWLPGLLTLARLGDLSVIRTAAGGLIQEPALTISLLGSAGSLSYLTLVAMALVAPVLLALGMAGPRWVLWLGCYAMLALTVLIATYASAVVALAAGSLVAVAILTVSPAHIGRRSHGLLTLLPFVVPLLLFASALPVAQETITRLLHPTLDPGGSVHVLALTQGLGAFLSRPLTGFGAVDVTVVSPTGWLLAGHNSFVVMAYEFGLVLLLPFVWLLVRVGRDYVGLLRRANPGVEQAIGAGLIASFTAAIVTGFITPVFGDVMQDSVIWTFAGLAIVWNSWKRTDQRASLVE
jgi:hypothetical protein